MKRFLCILLAAAAAACTTVGHEKVEDWPALEVVEHYVPLAQMLERCSKYTGFGMVPLACAEFNLAARRCDIWYYRPFASREVVEHERLHCQGYDHVGENTMRDFLTRYRAASGLAAARAAD